MTIFTPVRKKKNYKKNSVTFLKIMNSCPVFIEPFSIQFSQGTKKSGKFWTKNLDKAVIQVIKCRKKYEIIIPREAIIIKKMRKKSQKGRLPQQNQMNFWKSSKLV